MYNMYTPNFGVDILSTSLGLLAVSFLAILFFRQRCHCKTPPGPAWIPLVGNIKKFASDPDLRISLRLLQKKYGDIYKLYLGPSPVIIVSGYDVIKDFFIKRGIEFSDRPAAIFPTIILNGGKEEHLAATVMDLFSAGTETTSTTVTWASFYLATRPDIQSRIFEEIKANVGTERLPSMQDKQSLVYTEAFIMEVLRMSSIVILSIAHAPVTDVCIRDYYIPKGMPIFPDINSVLSDPEIWGDPENFRPERFVSEDGTLLKPDEFIPFFMGRRNCLGESLARMELLLFISALVQKFELMPPKGEVLDIKDVDGIFGGTHAPKPFYIRAIPRHAKT